MKTLSVLEHVRLRPAMYANAQQPSEKIFRAALAGSIDICHAGYGNAVHIVQNGNHIRFFIDGKGGAARIIEDMIYYNTRNIPYFTFDGMTFVTTAAWSSEFQCYSRNGKTAVEGFAFCAGKPCPLLTAGDNEKATGFCIDFTFDTDLFKGQAIEREFVEISTKEFAALFPQYPITLNGEALNVSLKDLIDADDVVEYSGQDFSVVLSRFSGEFRSFINGWETRGGGAHIELLLRTLAEEFPDMPPGWLSSELGGVIHVHADNVLNKFYFSDGGLSKLVAKPEMQTLLKAMQPELRRFLRDNAQWLRTPEEPDRTISDSTISALKKDENSCPQSR